MKKFAPALFAIWFLFFVNHAYGQWIHLGGPGHAYVNAIAVSGGNILALSGYLFLSTDNGTSWIVVDSGLTYNGVRCLAVSGSSFFTGTGGGVLLSTDSGKSWIAVNSGLTDTTVNSLAVRDRKSTRLNSSHVRIS